MAAIACELTRPTKLLIILIMNNYEFMQETGWYYINNKRTLLQTFQSQQSFTWYLLHREYVYGSLCMHCDMFVFLVQYNKPSNWYRRWPNPESW